MYYKMGQISVFLYFVFQLESIKSRSRFSIVNIHVSLNSLEATETSPASSIFQWLLVQFHGIPSVWFYRKLYLMGK